MTQPASSCFACHHPGHINPEQHTKTGIIGGTTQKPLTRDIRFGCPNCGREWTTNKEQAQAHGRFLDRLGLR